MHPRTGTIDLGELPHGEQPEILDPWPVRARLRRWQGRRSWRLAGAAAAAALVLVTVAAAAARPQPPLILHLSLRVANYNAVIDDQHLYVFEYTRNPEETVVAAYRLADGTVAWRTPVPGQGTSLGLWDEALLAITYGEASGGISPTDRTTRLDPASGRPLWTRPGWPDGRVDDLVLFSRLVSAEQGEPERTSLAMVDLSTGKDVWRIETSRWTYDPTGARTGLLTLDNQSTLTSYDPVTGEVLATAPTAVPTDPNHPSYWELRTFGPLVLLQEQIDGELVFNAYDVASLQLQWTLSDSVLAPWTAPCGELVCLMESGEVPRAVDPASGRTVWSADWLPPATAEDGYSVYDPAFAASTGHAVLTGTARRADDWQSWLIDMATGRPVLDLGQWQLADGYWPAPAESSDSLLTLGTQTGTWVGRLRPDLSGIDVLGQIEGATRDENGYGTSCTPVSGYIVCFTDVLSGGALAHTNMQVWRLR